MDRLQRLRFVAEYYPSLQGLRLVPFGIASLIVAAVEPGLQWFPLAAPPSWDLGPPLLAFAAALLANVALRGYYERRFGFHRPMSKPVTTTPHVATICVVLVVIGGLAAERIAGINLNGVVYAAIFAAGWRSAPGLRWYDGVAAVLLLGFNLLPMFGVGSTLAFFGQSSRFHYTLVGTLLVVCGLLDDRLLRELFAPSLTEAGFGQTI